MEAVKDTIKIGDPEYALAQSRLSKADRKLIMGACDMAKERGATGEMLAPFYALVFLDNRPLEPWIRVRLEEFGRKLARSQKHGAKLSTHIL